jgi:hypothetical protein
MVRKLNKMKVRAGVQSHAADGLILSHHVSSLIIGLKVDGLLAVNSQLINFLSSNLKEIRFGGQRDGVYYC